MCSVPVCILHDILTSETTGSINNLEVGAATAREIVREQEYAGKLVEEGNEVNDDGAIIPDHIETFSQQ